jgi:hypothetical protein
MWEARAAPGRLARLIAYVDEHAGASAQIYRADGPDPRVVVIDPAELGVPDVPPDLLARPAHEWHFDEVVRRR